MDDSLFDLYDREKRLLAEGPAILERGVETEIRAFAERLFERFAKVVRENEDLTRHSDRQEQRLVKLNQNLKPKLTSSMSVRQSWKIYPNSSQNISHLRYTRRYLRVTMTPGLPLAGKSSLFFSVISKVSHKPQKISSRRHLPSI